MYYELMYYISYHKQIEFEGEVMIGTNIIYPFASSAGANRGGQVYFRILNTNESIVNLQRFIYIYFDISHFEPTVVAVISFIEIPIIDSQDPSIVSYPIC